MHALKQRLHLPQDKARLIDVRCRLVLRPCGISSEDLLALDWNKWHASGLEHLVKLTSTRLGTSRAGVCPGKSTVPEDDHPAWILGMRISSLHLLRPVFLTSHLAVWSGLCLPRLVFVQEALLYIYLLLCRKQLYILTVNSLLLPPNLSGIRPSLDPTIQQPSQ